MPFTVATINVISPGAVFSCAASFNIVSNALLVAFVRSAVSGSSAQHTLTGGANASFTRIAVADNGAAQHISMWFMSPSTAQVDDTITFSHAGGQNVTLQFYQILGANNSAPFTTGEALGNISSGTNNPVTSYVKASVPDSFYVSCLAPNGGSVWNPNGASTVPLGSWVPGSAVTAHYVAAASASARHGWSVNGVTNYAQIIGAFGMATSNTPPGIERSGLRHITLVNYATPDVIPAGLKPVGIVSSASMPERIRRVKPNWVASPDLAPADQKVYGAVQYASDDLVPARMRVLGVEA